MKKIKIKYSGMGGNFDENDNFISNILEQHFIIELSDDPDYLIYSVNSTDYLNYKCVRIFYTAENLVPDFNICDYAIGFNYLSFEDRYMRYPLYLVEKFCAYEKDDYTNDLKRAMVKHELANTSVENKTEFCSFVYSNGSAVPCREQFYEELSKYKHINSGGRYKNNIGQPVEDKTEFQEKHKFVIAFENTSSPGYTTEKIVHAFSANSIPIYWGNAEIEKEFNPDSFINCNKLGLTAQGKNNNEIIQQIIDIIKEIDTNDEKYREMLKAPAFNNNLYVQEKKNEFEAFLINIFNQEYEQTFRRNRYYWGERYERKQRIGLKWYLICRRFIPIRDKVKKILGRKNNSLK